jgi:hypothetical protein
MARRQFRTAKQTRAFFREDEGYSARPLPAGSLILFDPYSLFAGVLLEVVWEDQVILIFADDLRSVTVQVVQR